MGSMLAHAIATIIGGIITLANAAYMIHLKVPSVIEVRPSLADVGLMTGLFSGRGVIYLWYHHPSVMAVISGFVMVVVLNISVLTVDI